MSIKITGDMQRYISSLGMQYDSPAQVAAEVIISRPRAAITSALVLGMAFEEQVAAIRALKARFSGIGVSVEQANHGAYEALRKLPATVFDSLFDDRGVVNRVFVAKREAGC